MDKISAKTKEAREHITSALWHARILLSNRGQAEGFWQVILLILAIATIIAMGIIYFYAAKGSETQLHNLTRSLRGFR